MNHRTAKKLLVGKKKSYFNNLSIVDTENFEPPQLSSTPAKINNRVDKGILKNSNSWNISIINKEDKKKYLDTKFDDQSCEPSLLVLKGNNSNNYQPELFNSDSEEKSIETGNISDYESDKWITISNYSENNSNISDIFTEIDDGIEVRFEKPPRRSYPGRKRINESLYKDDEDEEEMEPEVIKPKRKKKVDPKEDIFIHSTNEHFSLVESFELIVE